MASKYIRDLVEHLAANGGMPAMAEAVRAEGERNSRGGQDTLTAHITPHEAAILRARGGSGRTDASTGLLHFDEDCSSDCDCDCDCACGNCNCDGESTNCGDGVSDACSSTGGADEGGATGEGGSGVGGDGPGACACEGYCSSDGDGNTYAYGQYSGYDFNTYGWGDPSIGPASSPQEAAALHAAKDAEDARTQEQAAITAAKSAGTYDNFAKGAAPVSEEELQQGFDQNNWAGYDSRTGNINTNDTLSSSGRAGASDAAIGEYNSLSARGDFAQGWGNWSFTDLNGQQQTNWGAIANDVAGVLNNPVTQTIGSLTLGPAYNVVAGLSGLAQGAIAGKSNTQGILGTAGGLVGGKAGQTVGSLAGGLVDGKSVANNIASTALGMTGNLTGSQLGAQAAASQFGRGTTEQAVAGAIGGIAGGYAQSQAVNAASGALNSALADAGVSLSGATTSTAGQDSENGSNNGPGASESVASNDSSSPATTAAASTAARKTIQPVSTASSPINVGGYSGANALYRDSTGSDDAWLAGTSKALAATRERNKAALQEFLNSGKA